MKCVLCERDFSIEEISNGVPLPHFHGNRSYLIRFNDAVVHEFPTRKPKEAKNNLTGALVAKPPTTPVEPTPPEPTPTTPVEEVPVPSVSALAAKLESGWHQATPEAIETYHATYSQFVEVGEIIDAVVVFWQTEKKFGFARKVGDRGGKHRRDGLYFSSEDLCTTGEEKLHAGSRIEGTVTEPRPGHTDLRLTQVSIFKS
jgi:hypothetical protein